MQKEELPNLTRAEVDRLERKKRDSRRGRKPGIKVPALRLVRVSEDLSIGELADRADVARQTVARAEQGHGINRETLERLASVLGYHPDTLTRDWDTLEPEEDETES